MGSREKVLEAATGIFGKAGYRATSIDEILASAEVSPSNFYYHFKSKEELALEVLEQYFERFRQLLGPVLNNRSLKAPDKLDRIREIFVQKTASSGCCGGCPLGNLAQEMSDIHPEFRKRLAAFFDETLRGLAELVSDGVKEGFFRPATDPRAAAYLLFGSLEGLLLLTKSLKQVDPLEQGFSLAMRLLRNE
jgi:TetR/AcrR family transcriptional repressor of nem operon